MEHTPLVRPLFTVVIATFNRDERIAPTLESVKSQTLRDFEVFVVSDGPPSAALEKAVREAGPQFSLLALPERSRSQSGPNNVGWQRARGKHIAYLGHDDIWSPHHLEFLAQVFAENPETAFAVSGCIYLGPPGTGDHLTWVTGLFDSRDPDAPLTYFFPPSSLAHKRDLPAEVPRWSDPLRANRPVDTEFIIGAAERGCAFASTGRVSVFKFASALRYLSYLCPDDSEQREMLEMTGDEKSLAVFVEERLASARALGGYMAPRHTTREQFLRSDQLKSNETVRGIALPEVSPLRGTVQIGVGSDKRGFDWYEPEAHGQEVWRWSGPSPRPRVLIPYTVERRVSFRVAIARFAADDIRQSLQVVVNGETVRYRLGRHGDGWRLHFVGKLKASAPTVIEFRMSRTVPVGEINPGTKDLRLLGFSLVGLLLRPRLLPGSMSRRMAGFLRIGE